MLSLFPAPPVEFVDACARRAGARLVDAVEHMAATPPATPARVAAHRAALAAAIGFGATLRRLEAVDPQEAERRKQEYLGAARRRAPRFVDLALELA
jgi:translation elongation factor EF-Ts